MPRVVREQEVLRIAASLPPSDTGKELDVARREILAWTQKRSGGRLPPEAWRFESFEYLSGGRNSVGVRMTLGLADVWAIRADDPDKTVAGRIWTHEIVIGTMPGSAPRLSVRQLISSPEDEPKYEPHSPGFIQQLSETCGIFEPSRQLQHIPWEICSEAETEELVDLLLDSDRTIPVFVLTTGWSSSASIQAPLVDAFSLSRATVGNAHVVVLPQEFAALLTERFGKQRSVFGGAVRAYMPGFNEDANPYDHRLVIADLIRVPGGAEQSIRWLRSLAAIESIKRTRLGHDVRAFSSVKKAKLESTAEDLEKQGAGDSAKLVTANERLKALQESLEEAERWEKVLSDEHAREEQRAQAAEEQLRASSFRIQALMDQLQSQGPDREAGSTPSPKTWGQLTAWCDTELAGMVSLAPSARKGIKSADFEDLELVVRCIRWLAADCRQWRINGGDGSLRELVIEDGIRNSPCGGDEYDTDWQGRRYTADWHIKNGGNTRDPKRCLRIYYFWEPNSQQIVITDMPAHRRTGMT